MGPPVPLNPVQGRPSALPAAHGSSPGGQGPIPRSAHLLSVQAALDRARPFASPLSAGDAPSLPVRATPARPPTPLSGAPGGLGPRRPPASPAPAPFDDLIREAARQEQIDPALVRAVVKAESNFDPKAVSPAGAKGLMQLMDSTARSLGVTDSLDPSQNVAGGAKYLKQLLQRYGGDRTKAVAAYNAGPGAVDRCGGVPPYAETQAYVQRVLGPGGAGGRSAELLGPKP